MAKWRKQRKIVGRENTKNVNVSKPLFNLIVDLQQELQKEENNKKSKPKKISFLYASLELSRRVKK